MSCSVLIVDDDPVQRRLLEAAVTRFGYRPLLADGGQAACDRLDDAGRENIQVVVLDLVMPDVDGLSVLRHMRQRDIEIPVVVQTAKGGIDTAVAAMRAGAFDFVVKPASPERLKVAIDNAVKVETQGSAKRRAGKPRGDGFSFDDIVTQSAARERVLRLARTAATSDIPILVEGESGVGKELIARAIREAGDRRSRPFVTVNCGAIPDNLVESILFGHEKGSFTGATQRHVGKFVEAHTGTLFLDEIGDLPADVQVKLLRAVQDGEVDPVGASSTVKVDIRLISATNRNLLQRVKDGQFREDLFYRLNVFPIMVPPLRERRDDVPRLVRHFIERFSGDTHEVSGISERALELLAAYDWPGNIRQLENAVFRAVVLAEGDVLTADQFPQIRAQVEGIDESALPVDDDETSVALIDGFEEASPLQAAATEMPETEAQVRFGILRALDDRGNVRPLADVESEMIRLAVSHYNGQMSEVARRLGIGRSTLYRKLKELGIDPGDGRSQSVLS